MLGQVFCVRAWGFLEIFKQFAAQGANSNFFNQPQLENEVTTRAHTAIVTSALE